MNILNELKSKFGTDVKKGIVNYFNIAEKDAEKAMDIAVPTLMASVIRKVGTDRGTSYLQDLVDQEAFDGSFLAKISEPIAKSELKKEVEQGEKLLPVLLGSSIIKENILNITGKVTNLGYQPSKSIFSFLVPVVLNFVGKKVREENLDKNSLVKLLRGQKGIVKQQVHDDISRELGLGTWKIGEEEPLVFKEEAKTEVYEEPILPPQKSSGFPKWLIWPLLLVGVLGLLIFGILKGFNSDSKFAEKLDKTMPIKKQVKKEKPAKPAKKPKEKSSILTAPDTKKNQPKSFEATTSKPAIVKEPIKNAEPAAIKPIPVPSGAEKTVEDNKVKEDAATVNNDESTAKPVNKTKYEGPLALLDMVADRKVASVINFGKINAPGNELTSIGENLMAQVADIMKANPNLNITIRGHHKKHLSNDENSTASNAAQLRAAVTKAYIESKGISSNRIKSISVGFNEPVNAQDPGNSKNDRISIKTK